MKKILLLFLTVFLYASMAFAQTPPFYSTPGGTSNNSFPLNTSSSNKVQWIYGPGEFSTAGGGAGTLAFQGLIDTLWIRVNTTNANFTSGFEVALAQNVGTQSTWTSGTYVTGLSVVQGPSAYNFGTQAVSIGGGWVGIPLSTSFLYNPALSLVVQMRQSGYSPGTTVPQLSSNGNRRIWGGYAASSGSFGSGQANIGMSLASPLNCATPTNVAASNIAQTTLDLGWTDNNSPAATTWQIEYGAQGFTPTGNPQITTTNNPYTFTGLIQNTSYDFHVRAYCGPNDSSYYGSVYNVTTLASCPFPSNLTATNITSNSATLDWTENGSATTWGIEIGLTGFTPSGNATFQTSSKPFNLPGLPQNTCFDYYVQADCGPDSSVFIGPYTFCTLIAPLSCPGVAAPSIIFQEEFTNSFTFQTNIPNAAAPGWTNTASSNPRWALESNGTGSSSTGPNAGAQGSQGYAYLEVSCVSGGSDTLTSPVIDLSGVAGAARVKWFNHMYGPNSGKLEVFVDNGTSLTSIYVDSGQTHTGSDVTIDPWDSVVISLNAYVGQSIQLRFVGTAANPGGCSGDRGLDQVEIEACIACPSPTNLVATNVTGTQADIGWTNNAAATTWHLEVVPSGTPPTGIPTDTATTNPYTITGLTPFQAIDVYVRANCDTLGVSSYDGPLTIVPCSPLSGTYTVNASLPPSATNFQSFGAVDTALICGVSGPVIFEVDSASGPYNEQVWFDEVNGASATNTITFNGNGATLTSTTTSAERHVLRLDGSDYFRFNDLIISSPSTSSSMPVHLLNTTNGTNNNTFKGCTIEASLSATSSTVAAFAMSGSTTSATSACQIAADSNIIDSCTIRGGYYGMTMYGVTSSTSMGNQVTNNVFEDAYVYSFYNLYQNNLLFSGNDISRPNRTTVSTFYAIYASGTGDNSIYEKNRIHNAFGSTTTSTSTAYPIIFYTDASSVANSNIIQNNLIDNMEGNGTHYYMYMNSASNYKLYHNTIVADYPATGGTTRGIYITGSTTGQDIQNNIIILGRGGTGTKHGIYNNSGSSVVPDYNNVHITAIAGSNHYGYNGGNQTTLANWQASAGSPGTNSSDLDPIFLLPPPDYTPSNPLLNGTGNALGVPDDFLGAPRSMTNPDMGAFSFNVLPTDISITDIISPDPAVGCYSASDTVVVELTNTGSTPHNFTTNPTTITVDVTGPTTATLTALVSSGTLPTFGTLNVTLSPTVNMTANGVYTFDAYQSTVGDITFMNDTLAPVNYNVNLVAGSISATPDVICASGTTDVTISGNAGGFIQWQTSSTGVAPWTNVGSGMNPHTSAVLTSTIYYRALLTCNTNMDTTNVDTIVVNNPLIGTTITDTVCGADTVTLIAQAVDTSASVSWYDVPTGGTALTMGDTLTTFIGGTDTFYAAALIGDPNSILITEVCNFNNASGWTTPTPPVPSSITDPIELTNIGSAPVDISGWKVEVTGGSSGSYIIPAGNVVAPNSTFVLSRGSSGSPNTPGVFVASNLPTSSSGTALGVILSDNNSTVVDVVAYNGYNVVGTGSPMATAADWSGSVPSASGTAGIRRTVVDDNNDASDWTVASTSNLTNYGSVNVAFTPSGCEGSRTAVVAVSTPGPAVVASATDTLVCVGDSTMLLATGAGAGATYTWNNGGVTGVNFVPPSSPITYTLTGTNSAGCSSLDSVTIVKADTFSGVATASPDVHCISGSSVVDAVSGAFIQWQEAASATGPWTNVGTNSTTYNTGNLTSTMYYRALSTCGANTDTSSVDTVVVENPLIASTIGDTVCGPNSASLSASLFPGSGSTINWYDAPTGGTKLDTGSVFATPVISATDTFYAVGSAGSGANDSVQLSNASQYTGTTRGYHFVSPIDFTITKLFVPTTYSSAAMNIVVMKFPTTPPTFSATTTTYQVLYSTFGNTATGWIPVNIPIFAGDTIGILGDRATNSVNQYSSDQTITVDGNIIPIYRLIYQNDLGTAQALMPVPVSDNGTGSKGSVDFQYAIGCEGDPRTPVVAVVNPSNGDIALATSSNTSSTVGTDSLSDLHLDGQTLSYYTPSCELITTVDDAPGGNVLGTVTSKVNVDPSVSVWNGQPYVRRWYDIDVQNNGPATVTLYYTQDDFNDYNAHPSVILGTYDSLPTGPSSLTANIRITQISGGGLGVGTVTGVITPTTVWNAATMRWRLTFPVTGFSQFFLHAANPNNAALSVSLSDFTVVKNGSVSDASWFTLMEENNSHFNVQRSLDGRDFVTLGKVNSKAPNGTSTTKLAYAFTDYEPQIGHNYYRLEQVDLDGQKSYSGIVDLVWGADGSVVSIYPNPATDKLNVDVAIDKVTQMEVRLLDMSGRVVKSAVRRTVKGMNNVTLDLSDVAAGVYGVQVYDNNALIHTAKVNKQSK